jgi:hypothetical protein
LPAVTHGILGRCVGGLAESVDLTRTCSLTNSS